MQIGHFLRCGLGTGCPPMPSTVPRPPPRDGACAPVSSEENWVVRCWQVRFPPSGHFQTADNGQNVIVKPVACLAIGADILVYLSGVCSAELNAFCALKGSPADRTQGRQCGFIHFFVVLRFICILLFGDIYCKPTFQCLSNIVGLHIADRKF